MISEAQILIDGKEYIKYDKIIKTNEKGLFFCECDSCGPTVYPLFQCTSCDHTCCETCLEIGCECDFILTLFT